MNEVTKRWTVLVRWKNDLGEHCAEWVSVRALNRDQAKRDAVKAIGERYANAFEITQGLRRRREQH